MENEDRLDAIFAALADRRRRAILGELSEGSKTVGELARSSDLSMGAVSKNINILHDAELIHKSKRGRFVHCYMNFDIWREVAEFIAMHARFWGRRLDELESYIVTQQEDR